MLGQRKRRIITVNIDSKRTDITNIQSILKKYNIDPSGISLAPGENEGEFLLKIHVGSNTDAQQMLSLIGELTSGDRPATTAN